MKHVARFLMIFLMSMALVAGAAFTAAAQGEKATDSPIDQPKRLPGMGTAQDQQPINESQRAMMQRGEPMAVPRADAIIGLEVMNDAGQQLGKVEDLTFSDDGRINYLVISRGGVLGFGSKLCAIPWQSANTRIHENAVIVDVSKESLDNAPTFENWADFSQGDYQQQVRGYYGEEGGARSPSPGTHPADIKPGTGKEPDAGMSGQEHESGSKQEGTSQSQ